MTLNENQLSDQIGAEIEELTNQVKIPDYTCPLINSVIDEISDCQKAISLFKRDKITGEELADRVEMNL